MGTVSHVLNNRPNIGPDRKNRVLAAIEELNYKPNKWARGMGKGLKGMQTGQIALVFINISERIMHASYTMQYINGAQQEITSAGRKCLFLTWNETPGDDTIPHILLDGEIDGIILKGDLQGEAGNRWLSRFARVSLNPNNIPPDDCDCVMVDYQAGARNCVKYLASRGHRRIAIVGPAETPFFQSKLIGYKQAIKQLGLDADDALIQVRQVPPESDFSWAIDNLWSLPKPPTAILSNDYACGGIYRTLAARGMKVPRDVSIVGYDNALDYCEALVPQLTSMDVCATNVGKAAAQQLLERMKDPEDTSRNIYIQGRMVERASVKKL